ncbi:flagellar filament capping protein FliD [Treponema vincentii]|uniref:flagellar filament capping protein FliD n=1 Tax=Treponema vincentii TaxID=69710 RepID=UPI0020A30467|nr:flagellar filament capping protein FliD [Treponema vincentii]UTC49674.1 flagellar filament capping protein FliD [Treponema vincentii]
MNIPGIGAGKYDNLIETLMKKERAPRDSAAEDLKKYEQQNAIWRKINQFSTEIREKTRDLYSFNNPFVEKTVASSNERAVTATASRDAREQTFKISINQIAQADSFLSNEVSKDFQVPKGLYTFTVGEKKLSVNWQGGKYRSFIDAVNKKGKDVIRISEIKTSPGAVSLLFESQLTGEANRLEFSDDALSFALENGLIKKNDRLAVDVEKTEIAVPAQTTERIAFSKSVRGSQQYVLEYTVSLQNNADVSAPPSGQGEQASSGGNPIYEQVGTVSYKGVTVTNAPSDSSIVPETLGLNPVPAAPVEDYNVLSLVSSRGTLIPLPPLADTAEVQTFSIPLSEYGDITGITVHNNNTDKTVSLAQIKVYDPKATGEYIPVNPVSQAQEASLTFEGIPVKRSTNKIDDLIPGVTLQLEDKTDKPESISIKPDPQPAKDAIIEFVAKYNRLLAEINIVTSNQQAVIDEIEYFTDDERKTAEENLGALFGDTTLSSLKNNLRQIVTNVYRRNTDTPIRTLSQIGISTKSDTSSALNEARLRGYLEIDEKKLDEALKNSIEDVRYLFGYDTDNDVLIDDGVAYQVFKQIDPYVQRGGIFSTRTSGLAARIKTSKDKIARYDQALEKKEQELRQKYGDMDGSLRNLQKQSDMINNFSRQNRGSSDN